jgi:hypothetical protein
MKQCNVIKSISYDQSEILNNIIKLYCPDGFDLDPTFSKGNFYKKVPKPKFFSDINPQIKDTIKADCRYLPFVYNSLKAINFDPPFLNTQPVHETAINDIIHKRFGFINGIDNLWELYRNSLDEFYRILEPNGVLVFKCQDIISSAKQYLNHVEIINYAYKIGFYPKDIFILLAENRIISGKHSKQQHCRKYHSYFLVLIKKKSPVKYSCNFQYNSDIFYPICYGNK